MDFLSSISRCKGSETFQGRFSRDRSENLAKPFQTPTLESSEAIISPFHFSSQNFLFKAQNLFTYSTDFFCRKVTKKLQSIKY